MITRHTTQVNGKLISFLKAGAGRDIVLFLHGSGMSANNWIHQLKEEELTKNYTLVAIDLPGHGCSGWLADEKKGYYASRTAEIIPPLLELLNAEKCILAGISFGTNIIGEISSPIPSCVGIVLSSVCIVNNEVPFTSIVDGGPLGHVMVHADPSDDDLKSYVSYHMKNEKIAEQYISDFRKTDPLFREHLYQFVVDSAWTDELANVQSWNIPVCVIFGKNESLLKTDYLDNFPALWKKRVFLIEDAGHFPNEEQVELFNNILISYAEERFK